jgi:hypothetical protein
VRCLFARAGRSRLRAPSRVLAVRACGHLRACWPFARAGRSRVLAVRACWPFARAAVGCGQRTPTTAVSVPPGDTGLGVARRAQRLDVPGGRGRPFVVVAGRRVDAFALDRLGRQELVGRRELPPVGPRGGGARGIARLAYAPRVIAELAGECRQALLGHVVGVGEDAARSQHLADLAVEGGHPVGRQPVQRGRGEHGVEALLRQLPPPARITEVGVDDRAAVAQRGAGDRQEHRILVEDGDVGTGEPGQRAQRDRARAAGQVKEPRRPPAGGRRDRVEHGREALLPVGHERRLLPVPALLPRFRVAQVSTHGLYTSYIDSVTPPPLSC